MLPQDILILPSYLNTLLRDRYASLDELCDVVLRRMFLPGAEDDVALLAVRVGR